MMESLFVREKLIATLQRIAEREKISVRAVIRQAHAELLEAAQIIENRKLAKKTALQEAPQAPHLRLAGIDDQEEKAEGGKENENQNPRGRTTKTSQKD